MVVDNLVDDLLSMLSITHKVILSAALATYRTTAAMSTTAQSCGSKSAVIFLHGLGDVSCM